jgi:hypothetical protein
MQRMGMIGPGVERDEQYMANDIVKVKRIFRRFC